MTGSGETDLIERPGIRPISPPATDRSRSGPIMACVDHSSYAGTVVDHAQALGRLTGKPVDLIHVIDARPDADAPPDPLDWRLRWDNAEFRLQELSARTPADQDLPRVKLAQGRTVEEILQQAAATDPAFLVVGTRGEGASAGYGLGSTARRLLESMSTPILLVPEPESEASLPVYRRIVIPVDGSDWAESVLPLATRLAQPANAELILVHIVPAPELTEIGPLEPEDLRLREQVIVRNERIARSYLDRLQRRLAEQGLRARVHLEQGSGVRSSLDRLLRSQKADLVLMSARGHGGSRIADMPCGSVADYVVSHSTTPVLLVPAASGAAAPIMTDQFQTTRTPAIGLS